MTDDMMNLRSLGEKSADADLLREMIGFTAEKLRALRVGTKTGTGYGLPSATAIATGTGDTSGPSRAAHSQASHRQLFPELPLITPYGRERSQALPRFKVREEILASLRGRPAMPNMRLGRGGVSGETGCVLNR